MFSSQQQKGVFHSPKSYRLTEFHQASCSVGCQVSFLEGKWPGFEGESIHPEQSLTLKSLN